MEIWILLLSGCAVREICLHQVEALPRSEKWCVISMGFLQSLLRRHFMGNTICGVVKCWLFSQAHLWMEWPFCVNLSPGFSFPNFSGCTEGIWQNDWWCRRWKGQNGMCIACLSWRTWKKTWISACPLGKQLSHFACSGTLLACLSSWFC